MSLATAFPLFPDLPEELRREIWEASFRPRLISLRCSHQEYNETQPPAFVYHLPEVRLAGVEKGRTYTAFLTVDNFVTPHALCVCQESREWAKSAGYRPWKMVRVVDGKRKFREIMWDPKIDIVDLMNQDLEQVQWGPQIPSPSLLPILQKQFPKEVAEARYLAVSSRLWGLALQKRVETIWPLIDWLSLRELVVVIDERYERICVDAILPADRGDMASSWTVPEDIEDNMQTIRTHYEKYGPEYHPLPKLPSVRIVKDLEGLFRGEDMHIILRCSPCQYLALDPSSA